MADTPSVDDVRKEFEKQIADVRKELSQLAKSVSDRGEEVYDNVSEDVGDAYNGATRRIRGAARGVQKQAHLVSGAIKDNPGTAATVLSSAGIVGFVIGVCVGHLISGNSRRR